MGIEIENEEMLYIVSKGLPKEYNLFSPTIRIRNEILAFGQLQVLLEAEETSLRGDKCKDRYTMAMLATAGHKP